MRPTWPPTPPPIRGTVPPLSKWDVIDDPTVVTNMKSAKEEQSEDDWQKIDQLMKKWAKETFQFEPVSTNSITYDDASTETQTHPVERLENMLLDSLDKLAAQYQNASVT